MVLESLSTSIASEALDHTTHCCNKLLLFAPKKMVVIYRCSDSASAFNSGDDLKIRLAKNIFNGSVREIRVML